jgi:hypothetical protein
VTTRRRPPSRNAIQDALMHARSHLTARDWRILALLDEHRVLTAPQLCDLAFNDPTTARHRLAALYRLKVINRFRPPPEDLAGGSNPYHYVLDHYGALLIAQQQAAEADDQLDDDSIYAQLDRSRLERRLARINPDYTLAIATSQRLRHQVAVNGFFCALHRAARRSGGRRELLEWQGDKRAQRTAAYQTVCVRPDGFGVWAEDGLQLPFFLELDRGTETLDRLARKLDDYAEAEEWQQQSVWVLVSLPGEQREHGARRAMLAPGRPEVPVATTHRRLGAACQPDEAVWWPLRGEHGHLEGGRVRLVDLAAYPIPAGSVQRATAVRRYRIEEARRKAEQAAEHERWKQERQAREEATRQQALDDQQAQEAERPSNPSRWKVFGRWPASP